MATERKDGRWMARKAIDGKRLVGYGKTAEEADDDLTAKVKALHPGALSVAPPPLGNRPTLHEIAEAIWFPRVEKLAPGTQRRYTDLYIQHIRDYLGLMPVDEIGPKTVIYWLQELENRKVTANTRDLARGRLLDILNDAMRLEAIERNPCDRITVKVEREKRIRVLPVHKAQDVLDGVLNTPLSAPTYLALVFGLRNGEICARRWDNLDRVQRSFVIDTQRQIIFKTPGVKNAQLDHTPKPKGGKVRILRPTAWMIEGIDTRGDMDSDWICTKPGFNGKREQWRPATLTEYWANARGKFGLDDWHFHDLRHAATGLLIAGGCSLMEAAAVLGHTSIDTTLIYAALADEHRLSAADKMPILR